MAHNFKLDTRVFLLKSVLRMCGIISYIGKSNATQVLLNGLKRLEYRGYDSAGIAVNDGPHNSFVILKSVGRVETLAEIANQKKMQGSVGIGHTRWATHGEICEVNAHPHCSSDGKIILVHNGVIENYVPLKNFLLKEGFSFKSDTDSEVLCNLIAYHYGRLHALMPSKRFLESVRTSLLEVQGTYGIVALCKDCPQEMIGSKKSSPLVLGIHEDELFLASDVGAFAGHTKDAVFLDDNEIIHIQGKNFSIQDFSNVPISPNVETIDWDVNFTHLGHYSHYMQKEIFEQPAALDNTIRGRFSQDDSTAHLGGLRMSAHELRQVDRLLLLGCGTAYNACLVAENLIERYARIPVEVECASEFRYRNAPLEKNTLVFVVSQSGETIDTLAALRESQRKGFRTLAITNVVGSTIARESDGGIYQRSGPEIGVASTKAFTGQVCTLAMLALYLGRMRGMSFSEGCNFVSALKSLSTLASQVLDACDTPIKSLAEAYAHYEHFLFLGRQILYPIALEGALKLKELSYIHAEAYPAAELKHGPIALVDEKYPSLFLATDPLLLPKTIGNMMEVKARKGKVIAIGIEGVEIPSKAYDDIIYLPQMCEAILPIITVLPLQLFAYYVALERHCDVDKPRNLAKSVTVE